MNFNNNVLITFPVKLARLCGAATYRLPIRVLLSLGVAVLTGVQLSHFLLWSPKALTSHGFIYDDAFFYSVLSRNFKAFGFLTFDGRLPTNGVQPLWMLTQLSLTQLWPGVDEAVILARTSWVCYSLFAALTIWWVTSIRGLSGKWLAGVIVTGLILANVHFQALVVQGLETPLMLAVLISTLIYIDYIAKLDRTQVTPGRAGLLAVATVGCFLARTDWFWINLITGLWLVAKQRRVDTAVLTYFGVTAGLVSPYLLFNWLTQSSIMPMSGRVKLFYLDQFYPTWADYFGSVEWQGLMEALARTLPQFKSLDRITLLAVALFSLVYAFTLVWREKSTLIFPASLRVFSIVIACHILFMHGIYREVRPYTAYYFAPEMVWSAAVCAAYVARRPFFEPTRLAFPWHLSKKAMQQLALPALIVAGSVWIAWSAGLGYDPQPSHWWSQRLMLADDIHNLTPNEATIAAIWPGVFSQFSQKKIIPLDGIISSNNYFETYVKPHRQLDYILTQPNPYLAVYLPVPLDSPIPIPKDKLDPWNLGVEEILISQQIDFEIVSFRSTYTEEIGWYLIKFKPSNVNDTK